MFDAFHARERAALYRKEDPEFATWAAGYGVFHHEDRVQVQVFELADLLFRRGTLARREEVYRLLAAADRLASAAMWLVVHLTYARQVYLDGRDLGPRDFKTKPEGHTGGALNMVPAYMGYLAANAISGLTRAWLMGQGHCVAAIEAVNLLSGNSSPAQSARYPFDDQGLSRFVQDFYGYALTPEGRPAAPLGSHVNAQTGGGLMEGGYLGFAELQYVHMPLPGERLVAFLSDGAYEEQRGGDWAPRWWRAEDCGLVTPFLIANGRRIDQRTTFEMRGGSDWLRRHLELNGYTPLEIDGRDPAAYACAILHMEERLLAAGEEARAHGYPAALPFAIAEVPKGYGFPGADSNRAHNLPLQGDPADDATARNEFNCGARGLWVPPSELQEACAALRVHERQGRPLERDHPLAHRRVPPPQLPEALWHTPRDLPESPMAAIDAAFSDIAENNGQLRLRVGNPDEMRSNRLSRTLDQFRHRVTAPEPGVAEAVDGAVITALNEEAVVCAALGNKGGLNLVASYEAFAMKMVGALRQEILFARQQREAGQQPGWLGLPVIATSHTWENGKNEQSHQDTSFPEVMLAEMSDSSRVLFPVDWNSATATLHAVYASHGQIWTLVVPKRPQPHHFSREQAQALVRDGALRLRGNGLAEEKLVLAACGAYQLSQALRASDRLRERGIAHSLVCLLEPGRFRRPRDARERSALAPDEARARLFPIWSDARVFLTHTRPEPFLGTVWPLVVQPQRSAVLGFINQGGTLDVNGMLFANRCTWAHAVAAAASVLERSVSELLSPEERDAVEGRGDPRVLFPA